VKENSNYVGRKVAIIAPMSATGEVGGAERFYGGLRNALIDQGCNVELITIPMDESTFNHILSNYDRCRTLDLTEYDLVISTKAPTYAIKHDRHVMYLVHTTRVFYDMFDVAFPWAGPELIEQRRLIHKLDNDAMGRIKHRFAIGHEVANRLKEWNALDAEVLHPPLGMNRFRNGETGDYFFMPGRLHPWKRVDLVIRSVMASKLPLKLLIAGTGEAEKELRHLAKDDKRIEFLGAVSDDELVEYYANTLAVPFVPVREDYGYVTLEAFSSGKAVITCTDSGEPLHFVSHQDTGLICEPVVESLQEALEYLFLNKETARNMGLRGMRTISDVTWPKVAQKLLKAGFNDEHVGVVQPITEIKKQLNVTVLDMQPIDPPVGGGRLRLMGLYHALGDEISVRYVGSYDWPGEKYRRHHLSTILEEIDVPLSMEHHTAAHEMAQQAGGKVVIDIAFPRLAHLSPEFIKTAREAVEWADVVIFSHPWVFPLLSDNIKPTQLVVYDSQNVEGLLRAQLLNEHNPFEVELLRDVVRAEYSLGVIADLILACSKEDKDLFTRIYEWANEKIHVVPNGVMVSKTIPPTLTLRAQAKQKVGLPQDRVAAIFLGSDYQPNVDAANFILRELAVHLPSLHFVIAGGVGARIREPLPANVTVTGFINDQQKQTWLHACDLAVNPMFSGSGTNIKMFDFMAASLPVVTTEVGARGIATESTNALRVVSHEEFASEVGSIANTASLLELGASNRRWVENEYAWEMISVRLGAMLKKYVQELHGRKRNEQAYSHVSGTNSLRLAHFSTTGHKCGIGEYTGLLVNSLSKRGFSNYLVSCETPTSKPELMSADIDGEVGWFYDNVRWYESKFAPGLVSRIKEWGASAILIQYHPGFFSGDMLESFANEVIAAGITVVVTLHNFSLCDVDIIRRMSKNGIVLLSHSRLEVASAAIKDVQLNFLPFGIDCPEHRHKGTTRGRDWVTHPPVIATTGFIRKHKGLPELIKAIALLRNQYPKITLIAQCALYPSHDSQEELNNCLSIIKKHGLEENVVLNTGYYPIEELYRRISVADLGVLPYAPSSEGGSGSAATCLASGLPLIVSKASIFDELREIVFTLDSNSPETIASTIAMILNSSELYDNLATNVSNYAEENSWDAICGQLIPLLSGAESIPSSPQKGVLKVNS
jgi:glycosyltransferase involved in cell wall biosynthesis